MPQPAKKCTWQSRARGLISKYRWDALLILAVLILIGGIPRHGIHYCLEDFRRLMRGEDIAALSEDRKPPPPWAHNALALVDSLAGGVVETLRLHFVLASGRQPELEHEAVVDRVYDETVLESVPTPTPVGRWAGATVLSASGSEGLDMTKPQEAHQEPNRHLRKQ